jgi:hypothetical protein
MLDGCAVLPPMEPAEPTAEQSKPKRRASRRKTGNRFAVLNAFVDAAAGELSRSEILVWLVLYRDTRNGIAETSQADIARRARLSSRTVRYAIGRLTKRGLLALVYRGGLNRGTSKYRVLSN